MRTTADQLYPDIWQQVFEYFNVIELFTSLLHVTSAADEVLSDRSRHFCFRGLVVDAYVRTFPQELTLSQVIPLELHQERSLKIIEQCSELRSLKLIGQPKWIICLIKKIAYVHVKLEQLILVVPGIGSLHNLLASIASLLTLRRLAIYANELEERVKPGALSLSQTKIENFTLHSCSSFSWNEFSYMLPGLSNIRLLDITLFHDNISSFCWFTFPKLRCVRLILLEVPFEWIIRLVKTIPSLVKLKLTGLVNAEGFVNNHRWLELFELCTSLTVIQVNVSLEKDASYFCSDTIQMALREINLSLICAENACEYYLSEINQHRWWSLSGTIIRQHE